jgi:molecular chaperone HscB
MKYFELYELPISFLVDEAAVKKKYFTLSRQFHPDFFSNADADKQAAILETSTLVNKAFQTLSDFDKRMKYILLEKGVLQEEEKFMLPQDFLIAMMELNETLMEVKMEGEPEAIAEMESNIKRIDADLTAEILPLLETYHHEEKDPAVYLAIKTFYFKRKYLQRVKNQLLGKVEM